MFRKYYIFTLLIMTISCSSNTDKTDLEYSEYLDLQYGLSDVQKMDLYLPSGRNKNTPLLIVIHGGAWIYGDKAEIDWMPLFAVTKGYASANINYRLADGTAITSNEILSDIGSAINKLKAVSADLTFSTDNIIIAGHSAGANIAMLYAYSKNDPNIKGVISLCGPADLSDDMFSSEVKDCINLFIGKSVPAQSDYDLVSPVKSLFLKPTLMIYSKDDELVPYPYQAESLKTILDSNGISNQYVLFDTGGHSLSGHSDQILSEIHAWCSEVFY